jgi:glutamate-1-semialdehyde 2,1-aminomutase
LSKGVANGYPLAVVVGKKEYMKIFENDNFFASTTFGGDRVGLAAALVTLDILLDTVPYMVEYGTRLMGAFNEAFRGYPAYAEGYPTRSQFVFPTTEHKALFWQECVKRGVLFGYSNFIMAAHDEEDFWTTRGTIFHASETLKKHWEDPKSKVEGSLPVEVFRGRRI